MCKERGDFYLNRQARVYFEYDGFWRITLCNPEINAGNQNHGDIAELIKVIAEASIPGTLNQPMLIL